MHPVSAVNRQVIKRALGALMFESLTPTAACLYLAVKGPSDDIHLLFTRQLDKVHCIAGHANGQLGIVFRVFHGILEHFPIQDVDINMVTLGAKIAIEHAGKVADLAGLVFAEGRWD